MFRSNDDVAAKRISNNERGLPVYSPILFTCKPCKPGSIIGVSSVNPLEKTEMISITITPF